jgi:hypothetical protein
VDITTLRKETHALLTSGSWFGWLWIDRHWTYACRADSLGEASALLSKVADAHKVKDVNSCLTRGAKPSWQPDQRRHH